MTARQSFIGSATSMAGRSQYLNSVPRGTYRYNNVLYTFFFRRRRFGLSMYTYITTVRTPCSHSEVHWTEPCDLRKRIVIVTARSTNTDPAALWWSHRIVHLWRLGTAVRCKVEYHTSSRFHIRRGHQSCFIAKIERSCWAIEHSGDNNDTHPTRVNSNFFFRFAIRWYLAQWLCFSFRHSRRCRLVSCWKNFSNLNQVIDLHLLYLNLIFTKSCNNGAVFICR